MTISAIQPAFLAGELSPSTWGRVDLEQFHTGAATMKNMWVNYRGGASSRAGSAYVGLSKTAGTSLPPRLIKFQYSITQSYILEFGNLYMRVIANGGYVLGATKAITGATQADPVVITAVAHGWSNNDWVYVASVGGMTELNGQLYIISNVATDSFSLSDLFGNPVDGTAFDAYTSGGTAARVVTVVSPYAIADLPTLKFTQSADVMSFTHPDYPPYDLTRNSASSWTFAVVSFGAAIAAPGTPAVAASVTTSTGPTEFSYVITAVDRLTGEESVPSSKGSVTNSVDTSQIAGSIRVRWAESAGAAYYNIYRAPVGYNEVTPYVSLYSYLGTTYGVTFLDGNIVADTSRTPPQHLNPFAPGQILYVTMTNNGSGYTSQPTVSITTATGAGAILAASSSPSSGTVGAVVVVNGGHDYRSTDTISFSGGGGANAAGTLTVGPLVGTYPAVVSYFQQRRVYAAPDNTPDTYFMSQTGKYKNFDQALVVQPTDAITGTPWAQQVNGIQAMVPMPGGLVVLTGLGAWQVNGGGAQAAITPTTQNAQAQAFNGCNATVPPIVVNYDILYVQSKGTIVRDLAYDFYTNIYTGTDVTVLSAHLFDNYQILEWAWSEEPYKLLWAVRDDGIMLSMTYIKEQKIIGWARHDTQGQYVSVASATEPPVDAVYTVVKRYLRDEWVYVIERFDDHLWNNVENCWCVDSGLSLPQPEPAAMLTMSSSIGDGGILEVLATVFGSGYVAPVVTIEDPTGSGASVTATVDGDGRITDYTVVDRGTGYTAPTIAVTDSVGTGALASITLGHFATFTADASVFAAGDVGDVIRAGGGKAEIVDYVSATEVTVDILSPIVSVVQDQSLDDPLPLPQPSGSWSMTTPVDTVTGLSHLIGQEVAVLADGSVVTNQTVSETGTITLPVAASAIIIGLPFVAQLQTMYLDINSPTTIQGKRKNIQALTVRVSESRGIKAGTNQPNASTQQPLRQNVTWTNMIEIKQRGNSIFAGTAIPLFTGDQLLNLKGIWGPESKPGQVALQQTYPLPMNILATIPEFTVGDTDG